MATERVLARAIDGDVARALAARRLLIEQAQAPARRVDREGRDGAGLLAAELADFPHGIEEPPARVHGQERRIHRLARQTSRSQLARDRVELEQVDPPARAVAIGVCPDVDPILRGSGAILGRSPRSVCQRQRDASDQQGDPTHRRPSLRDNRTRIEMLAVGLRLPHRPDVNKENRPDMSGQARIFVAMFRLANDLRAFPRKTGRPRPGARGTATEAGVERPDREDIALPRQVAGTFQPGAFCLLAARDVRDELHATGLLESVSPQVEVLIVRGDPGRAGPHAAPPGQKVKKPAARLDFLPLIILWGFLCAGGGNPILDIRGAASQGTGCFLDGDQESERGSARRSSKCVVRTSRRAGFEVTPIGANGFGRSDRSTQRHWLWLRRLRRPHK